MQVSYDEIRRLSFRALDAAGAAAGIDEDSAHAVAWLEATELPGLAILADALDESAPTTRAAGLDPISASSTDMQLSARQQSAVFHAAAVIDLLVASAQTSTKGEATLVLDDVRHPVVLVASASRFCPNGAELTVSWSGVNILISNGHAYLPECGARAAEWLHPRVVNVGMFCTLRPDRKQPPTGTCLTSRLDCAFRNGIEVDDGAYARVSAYAAEILVPESDASRLSGAGAGLTDND